MGVLDKVAFWKKKEDDFSDFGMGDSGFDKMGTDFSDQTGLNTQEPGLQQPGTPQQGNLQPGMPESPHDDFGSTQPDFSRPQPTVAPTPSGPTQFSAPDNSSYVLSKNMEIISYKLDALRAAIDSLTQKVANLERIASEEPKNRPGW